MSDEDGEMKKEQQRAESIKVKKKTKKTEEKEKGRINK